VTGPSPSGEDHEQPRTERTDSLVGDAERLAAEWAEKIGRWIARAGARAREDAEDIWADAEALRRKL
jgi:hypothetical protein